MGNLTTILLKIFRKFPILLRIGLHEGPGSSTYSQTICISLLFPGIYLAPFCLFNLFPPIFPFLPSFFTIVIGRRENLKLPRCPWNRLVDLSAKLGLNREGGKTGGDGEKKRGTKNILARKKFSLELRLLTYECYSHRKTCPIFSLSQWILTKFSEIIVRLRILRMISL